MALPKQCIYFSAFCKCVYLDSLKSAGDVTRLSVYVFVGVCVEIHRGRGFKYLYVCVNVCLNEMEQDMLLHLLFY